MSVRMHVPKASASKTTAIQRDLYAEATLLFHAVTMPHVPAARNAANADPVRRFSPRLTASAAHRTVQMADWKPLLNVKTNIHAQGLATNIRDAANAPAVLKNTSKKTASAAFRAALTANRT